MPFEPQRFIHAANVRLDVPVSVHMSEQLTDELRHALEDATLTAFDFVIETCIAKNVDYLLLSGNVFLEADRSLRARLTLLDGFRRLHAKQIPVFVLPGDADPAEAWRTIPEMPDNVTVCYSSNPEPEYLERSDRIITTVSASMWYGETDSFGIRVIGRSEDGVEPFRIGIVSRAKYDESRRMAALSASNDDDFLNLNSEDHDEADDEQDNESEDTATGLKAVPAAGETTAEYEAGFRDYIENLMREARLSYVAYMGELDRLTITLESGKVHCTGTTQPRNQLEADCGLCSLVHVDSAGKVRIDAINTSAVDWKNIDLRVESTSTLNRSLEQMKKLLLLEDRSASDGVWAVCWTVRGPLPVLQNFIEDDLELAVAVELEEMEADGHHIRLVHEIRTLPDPWEVPDKASLAQQYADLITEDAIVSRRKLMNYVRREKALSEGWRQRFEALVAGADRERILSRMRVDGSTWFVGDTQELLPDLDDFDEDILQDEEIEQPGLSGDDVEETMVEGVASVTATAAEEMLDEYEDGEEGEYEEVEEEEYDEE